MNFEGWTDEDAIKRVKLLPEALQPFVKVNDPYWCYLPAGWTDLVLACHSNILLLVDTYEIHQIKEKFGGLRYYTNLRMDNHPKAVELVHHYEEASFQVCDTCGGDGEKRQAKSFYIATRCDACFERLEP